MRQQESHHFLKIMFPPNIGGRPEYSFSINQSPTVHGQPQWTPSGAEAEHWTIPATLPKVCRPTHSTAPPFRIGDHVFVKAKYFCTTCLSRKLVEKNLGPYEIIGHPGTLSFTLQLPEQFHSVHPVFHVSQLEPTKPGPLLHCRQLPLPPVEVEGSMEYEIRKILDSKLDQHFWTDRALCYLVQWTNYEGTNEETSWVPTEDLEHAPYLQHSFHHHYPQKPSSTPPLQDQD